MAGVRGSGFAVVGVLLAVLLGGCSAVVAGSGSGSGDRPGTTTTRPTTTTTTTTTTTAPTTTVVTTTARPTTTAPTPPPTSVDESAPAQYCDRPFTGALGKEMLAVVVETPAGRLDCDKAAAVLVDYYAQRSEPKTGLPPLAIGPLSCNQIPEGALPQVVCADGDNLIYSMWQQR
ncbi:hypothetical protein [Umezawaea tangerina]|uniref:Uncharacterized protein n=1 Tax=Umezawaea tangerina TaxID=84725 RepID=A0A2T0T9D1_9PSEU|nr:hypothetical protein [Umezawaea tangerina]PRY42254.1 hypothetical protein CLV43_10484 [Umezawaea tangerina]